MNDTLAVIADTENHCLRLVNLVTSSVSFLSGSGVSSYVDGSGTTAGFSRPSGLSVDGLGNIVVADTGFLDCLFSFCSS